jgi:FtsP/CotA-like multicopper oxidase with cupredoxin domain
MDFEDAPSMAVLGTMMDGMPMHQMWDDPISEMPILGQTETWEIYNFTADAHPIHLHQVQFQVVNRQDLALDLDGEPSLPAAVTGPPIGAMPWETGFKDTVIAYPGQVTRIKAKFDILGKFVWHCHIVEHEDNEMMRPLEVVATQGP